MDITNFTQEAKNELLKKIIEELDRLDEDDFFGTEGWKHHFGIED